MSLTEKIHLSTCNVLGKANETKWKFIVRLTSLDIPKHFCCWEISDSIYSDNAFVTENIRVSRCNVLSGQGKYHGIHDVPYKCNRSSRIVEQHFIMRKHIRTD